MVNLLENSKVIKFPVKEEDKRFLIITEQFCYECNTLASAKKKIEALEFLSIPYQLFQETNGEKRKVLVEIGDLVV